MITSTIVLNCTISIIWIKENNLYHFDNVWFNALKIDKQFLFHSNVTQKHRKFIVVTDLYIYIKREWLKKLNLFLT